VFELSSVGTTVHIGTIVPTSSKHAIQDISTYSVFRGAYRFGDIPSLRICQFEARFAAGLSEAGAEISQDRPLGFYSDGYAVLFRIFSQPYYIRNGFYYSPHTLSVLSLADNYDDVDNNSGAVLDRSAGKNGSGLYQAENSK
jgi:hypothetical protein